MSDPKRWLEDPSISEALRSDLQQAVDHPPAPPISPTPPPAPGALLPWVAVGAVGIVLVALGSWWMMRDSGSDDFGSDDSGSDEASVVPANANTDGDEELAMAAPVPRGPSESSTEMVEPPAAHPNAGTEIPTDEPVDDTTSERAEPAEPAHRAPRAAPAPTLEDEVRSMAAIRQAFTTEPARALRLARRAQRTFASGIFGEERAAMIALSLHRLGRTDAARRSARAFLRHYPSSTFRAEVEEIVREGEGSTPGRH